jgi:DNA-binding CsgD family transcriptional regulator
MNSDYIAILEKILEMQYALLNGYSLRAVMRSETKSIKQYSGAGIVAVAMGEKNYANIDLAMDEKRIFSTMCRKYSLSSKHIYLNPVMEYCHHHYEGSRKYVVVDSIHKIFDGAFSKTKSLEFEKEIDFHKGYIFPIKSIRGKRIGFVLYIFNSETIPKLENMAKLTDFFEKLIRPFYDLQLQTLRSKCVQVDNQMEILTDKEKQIAFRILNGKPYKEIAVELEVSINTIKTHTKNIFSKYVVNSKIELQNKMIGHI